MLPLQSSPDYQLTIKIMQRGVRVEKYILQEYAERSEVRLNTNIPTIVDQEYPFMRANIDAKIIGQNVIVEAKSTKAPDPMSSITGRPCFFPKETIDSSEASSVNPTTR